MASTKNMMLVITSVFLMLNYLVTGRDFARLISNVHSTTKYHPDIFADLAMKATNKSSLLAGEEYLRHHALLRTAGKNYRFFGAEASLSVWKVPKFSGNYSGTISSIHILIASVAETPKGSPPKYDVIETGWHVYPDLYGDWDTHFFVFWVKDGRNQCYNRHCPGFVLQRNPYLMPGHVLRPTSWYLGPQYYINLKLTKDIHSGDWWIYSGENFTNPVGYFPKSLFSNLRNYAEVVQIGGSVVFVKGRRSPPMGNGRYASEGKYRATSISYPRVQAFNGSMHVDKNTFELHSDNQICYTIAGDAVKGLVFVGGPGGCIY